jgi:hypothetical protein
MDSQDVAMRVLVVYEAGLPMGRPATLAERAAAMTKAVVLLGLKETSGADLKEVIRTAAEGVTD